MLGERAALDNQRFCFWFGPVASAGEAMVWESVTDGNPSVDADESSRRRLDRTGSVLLPKWFELLFNLRDYFLVVLNPYPISLVEFC